MNLETLRAWPALQCEDADLPDGLYWERGIWGKVPGLAEDFRWIATAQGDTAPWAGLERELSLGAEDEPRQSQHWRSVDGTHYAVQCYPSRSVDAAGRSSFLEKQVLVWHRIPEVPMLLGSLIFLPRVASWSDAIWWKRRSAESFEEGRAALDLGEKGSGREVLRAEELEKRISEGIDDLERALPAETLGEIYGRLLVGQRGLPLLSLQEPLSPLALACLALPLSRELADTLSLSSWIPSGRTDREGLRRRWHIVGGGKASVLEKLSPLAPEELRRGRRLAEALYARDPKRLRDSPGKVTAKPWQMALWGPSAAGKTVLLAQLYLHTRKDPNGWEIFPSKDSLRFIRHMRSQMYRKNIFPTATAVGMSERIVYKFHHPKREIRAALAIEDRAGVDFEDLQPEAQERLQSAQGLVLLFDPTRDPGRLESEVAQTLEEVHVTLGEDTEKDGRPIAVCVSKADVLITSPEDLDLATEDPDAFVRQRVDPVLVEVLDRFCSNYALFPVSAAGLRMRYGVVESTVFFDENMVPRIGRNGQPVNLMAPFAWVLDQLEAS